MTQFHNIGRHSFFSHDRLFFDTNIWIPLFDCRNDPNRRESPNRIYEGALKRALAAKSQLFTHPFVISEFVNRMVHDEHNFQFGIGAANKEFKIWRGSSGYRSFAPVVAEQVRSFMKFCTLVEHSFGSDSFENCLLAFEDDSRDLNDELLLAICESCELTLVTHDGDFRHATIPILTANTAYLR